MRNYTDVLSYRQRISWLQSKNLQKKLCNKNR